MQYTSAYPYFIVMILLLGIAMLISRSTFYTIELNREGAPRLSSVDGLRGFLALGVFFHHSVIMYYYYMTGEWKVPPSSFYTLLGEASVPLFFMITGFLFWTKILESELNIKHFFVRRVQRIVPLYIFTTLSVIVIVLITSKFTINVNFFSLVTQITRWFSFTFLGTPDINGFKDTFTIESVYWTLRWEWMFYFSLPLLAFFKKKSFSLIIILILFSVYFQQIHLLNFVLGILAATILSSTNTVVFKHLSFQVIATLGVVSLFMLFHSGYGILQSILLFAFFLSILFGNTLFGLLKIKAARLLGMISYSIYLIHNIVLWIMFKIWSLYIPIETITALIFWMIVICSSIAVVLVSTLTYKYIEHYFYISRFTLFVKKSRVNAK